MDRATRTRGELPSDLNPISERVAERVATIYAAPLSPRRHPARGDTVIPREAVRGRVGWKGATYQVRVARHGAGSAGGMYSFCAGCTAPIDMGDLYAPRFGSRPLCLDCVESVAPLL